jgi:hypothetical protein
MADVGKTLMYTVPIIDDIPDEQKRRLIKRD